MKGGVKVSQLKAAAPVLTGGAAFYVCAGSAEEVSLAS